MVRQNLRTLAVPQLHSEQTVLGAESQGHRGVDSRTGSVPDFGALNEDSGQSSTDCPSVFSDLNLSLYTGKPSHQRKREQLRTRRTRASSGAQLTLL